MNYVDFLDTNVLVYAFDSSEGEKHAHAKKLLEKILLGERRAAISNQVLAEFFSAVTKKIEKPVSAEIAQEIVDALTASKHFTKLNYVAKTVSNAATLSRKYAIPFWDALIAQTALENGVFAVVTENDKHFRKIPGIKVINPFKQRS